MEQQIEGTCLVVGAATVFALVALVVKVDPLPLLPATECRFLVSLIVSTIFMLLFRKSRGLHWLGPPHLRGLLFLKSATSYGFITMWWAALRHAPIGDCIAIIYTAPILVSLLSRCILGEALPRVFPLQVVLVIAGTLLIADPPFLHADSISGSATSSGQPKDYSLVFAALLLASITPIVTRQTRDCSWIEVEFVNAAFASAVLNPALLCLQYAVYGVLPEIPPAAPAEAGLLLLAALGSFVGIAMETKGYQLAEAGKATMFRYVEVPLAYALQHFGTAAPVAPRAILGSVLILASCGVGALMQDVGAERTSAKEPFLQAPDDEVSGA
eukprot:TRINITY_DN23842_c0_g1_i2.p1 TRINITY_DN23842_c0_g1~~TRINITY_DN23842_c0_g1_i2.p1  ORF type:complete len:336 (+),score=60.78 TRINITY_DN23842_c0_g1_i2:26-1009(+)